MEEEDDDYMLQAAIAMSLGQEPPPPPAAPAGVQAAPPALPQQPGDQQPGPQELMQMLQQFSQGIAPRGNGPRRGAAGTPAPPPVIVPAWIAEFTSHKLPEPPAPVDALDSLDSPDDAERALSSITAGALTFRSAGGAGAVPIGSEPPIAGAAVVQALSQHASATQQDRLAVAAATLARADAQLASGGGGVGERVARFVADACAGMIVSALSRDDQDDLFFAGGQVRSTFLKGLATGAVPAAALPALLRRSGAAATPLWRDMLRAAFAAFEAHDFRKPQAEFNAQLAALAAFTADATMLRLLAGMLLEEVVALNRARAAAVPRRDRSKWCRDWAQNSVLGPLLRVSSYLDPKACLKAAFDDRHTLPGSLPAALKDVRGYPQNRSNASSTLHMAQRSMQAAHDAAHAILKRIAVSKALAPAGAGREAVLAWLAAALYACEPRTDGGEKAPLQPEYITRGCPDAFALGVAGVALAFVAPVLDKADKARSETLPRVDAAAAGALAHRLGSLVTGRRLALPAAAMQSTAAARESDSGAAAMDVDDDAADDAPPALSDTAAMWVAASASLDAPANFMTECYFVAVRAMQTAVMPAVYRHQELMHDLNRQLAQFEELQSGRWPEAGSPAHRILLVETTAADCASHALLLERFAVTATRLLALLLSVTEAALAAAGGDSAAQADAAARIPEAAVRDAVNFATYVIHEGAPDLLTANRTLGATMRALTAILRAPGVSSTMARAAIVDLLRAMLGHGGRRGASLSPPPTRPGARALTEAVYGAVSSAGVVPALMTAYADAAVVEGLDVDKFHFDKYSMRSSIDEVLQQLWRNSQCEADLLAMAAPGHPQCETLTGFLKALLNDLSYLMDDSFDRIADINAINAAKVDSAAWDALSQRERDTKLSFRDGQRSTAAGFMSMAQRTLALILGLVRHDALRALFYTGSLPTHAAHLTLYLLDRMLGERSQEITRCRDIAWKPDRIMADLAGLMLALARDAAFVKTLAMEQIYSEATLRTAKAEVDRLETRMPMAAGISYRLQGLIDAAGAARAASAPAADSLRSSVDAVLALRFDGEADLSEEALDEAYRAALRDEITGTFDRGEKGAYMYELAKKADAIAAVGSRARQKRIMRELKGLQAPDRLPCNAKASVFLRTDEERIDVVRTCITGPAGTPYAYGMFFFDVLFPQDYPTDAPLMLLETTGGGRVRFNPNLYADGKVCLSLLGTWHSTEAEKWQPESSSLWQILLSIQGMVLVEDPYFNEPNVEQMRGQAEGDAASARRNSQLQLDTMRWAMLDVLRNPRPGFEGAIRAHFRAVRAPLLAQCQAWLRADAAQGALQQERVAKEIAQLYDVLKEL